MLATNTVSGRLFRSFMQRNYRMLWFSDGATSSAEQMEILVLAWFVLIETDSAFLVGVYGALRFTGTLFAPFYGILVDRYDRLSLLRIARVIFTVSAVVIAALAFTGQIHIWQIFLLTGITGMARAFDNVTRQTLMADMVPRYNLGNAIALTRTGRDATQIVSPVIGGLLLDSFGLGWAYVAIIALLAIGALLTLAVNPPPRRPATRGESIFSTLWDSFRYAWGNKVILALLLLAFLVNLTGFPLNQGLVPVFAHDVLLTDSTGLGWLLGAYSAGAFVGSIIIAGLGSIDRAGRAMTIGSVAWHAAVALLAGVAWLVVSPVSLSGDALVRRIARSSRLRGHIAVVHDGNDVHAAFEQRAHEHTRADDGLALVRGVRSAARSAGVGRDSGDDGHRLRAHRERGDWHRGYGGYRGGAEEYLAGVGHIYMRACQAIIAA